MGRRDGTIEPSRGHVAFEDDAFVRETADPHEVDDVRSQPRADGRVFDVHRSGQRTAADQMDLPLATKGDAVEPRVKAESSFQRIGPGFDDDFTDASVQCLGKLG
jgi:hypothetical protein